MFASPWWQCFDESVIRRVATGGPGPVVAPWPTSSPRLQNNSTFSRTARRSEINNGIFKAAPGSSLMQSLYDWEDPDLSTHCDSRVVSLRGSAPLHSVPYQPLVERSVQIVLQDILPDVTFDDIRPVPSLGLPRLYDAQTTDGRVLRLVMAPPCAPGLRLLRFERSLVISEVLVIRWLRDAQRQPSFRELYSPCFSDGGLAHACSGPVLAEGTSDFLPNLLHHSHPTHQLDSPFAIMEPVAGMPICSMPRSLSTRERRHVNHQVSQLVYRLSHLTSPSGRFGPAAAVLSDNITWSGPVEGGGSKATWSEAFHAMLEAILRDAEDMVVFIPYAALRAHFHRLRHFLDGITIPCFVVIDAAEDSNTLVLPSTEFNSEAAGAQAKGENRARHSRDLVVTGLMNWSNCVFGDPLFAISFSQLHVSARKKGLSAVRQALGDDGFLLDEQSVENPEHAGIRLLLYQAYHAICKIVREFYRRQLDSKEELAARRMLSKVLAKLGEVADESKRKTHIPSSVSDDRSKKKRLEKKRG